MCPPLRERAYRDDRCLTSEATGPPDRPGGLAINTAAGYHADRTAPSVEAGSQKRDKASIYLSTVVNR